MVQVVLIKPHRSRWLVGGEVSDVDECAALAMLYRKIMFALEHSVSVHWGLRAKCVGWAIAACARVDRWCDVPVPVASAFGRIASNRRING